jgi:polyhydroxyalkanoate synthesis repressor PhaR
VPTILIKKYGNRRLYDTEDSKYVTLEELAEKIRKGFDVRVVDAQTDEDLTQATLVQVVLEAGGAAFLPVQLLLQMIRLSDDALAEFFSRYVTGALEMYLQAKRGVQSIASLNPFAHWNYATFQGAPPPVEDVPPTGADRDRDISAMRRELDELKQAIREGFAGKAPARKKRKP